MHEAPPSKTRRKAQMAELQSLGVALAALSAHERARLALPEALAEAIDELARMPGREAKRRQRQYIGRLMRAVDVEPIRAALGARIGRVRVRSSAGQDPR